MSRVYNSKSYWLLIFYIAVQKISNTETSNIDPIIYRYSSSIKMFQKYILSSGYLMTHKETHMLLPGSPLHFSVWRRSRSFVVGIYWRVQQYLVIWRVCHHNISLLLPSHTPHYFNHRYYIIFIIAQSYSLSWRMIYESSIKQWISHLPFRPAKDLLQVEDVHNLLWDSATTYYVCNNSWYIMTCVIRARHISLGLQSFTGPTEQLWIFNYIPLAAT